MDGHNAKAYKMLAVAIVRQAASDWRYMCKCEHGSPKNDRKEYKLQHGEDYATFAEMKEFFESGWCDMLCGGVDAEMILDRLTFERDARTHRATAKQRKAVKRKTYGKRYTLNGETHTLTEWADILGIKRNTLNSRIYTRKWSVERTLTTKTGGKCDN